MLAWLLPASAAASGNPAVMLFSMPAAWQAVIWLTAGVTLTSGLGLLLIRPRRARRQTHDAGLPPAGSSVERLPEIYREALRLTEFEGVSQVELARRLGLSVSAAKSRVQRARAMVRAEMERCCRWETDRYGTAVDAQPRRADCCAEPPSGGK